MPGLAEGLDREVGAGPGQVQGGAGGAEAQGRRAGQVLAGLQQAAVLGPAVVAELGEELERIVHVNPFDDRDDLARFGVLDDLAIVFHSPASQLKVSLGFGRTNVA